MLRSLVTRSPRSPQSLGLAFALALVLALATAATAARPQPALLVLEGELLTDNGAIVGEREWIHAGEVAVAETDVLLLSLWSGAMHEIPAGEAVAAVGGGASMASNPHVPYVAGCICVCGSEWVFMPSGSPGSGLPTLQQCQQLQGSYCFPTGGGGGTQPPVLHHCFHGFGPGIPMMGVGGTGGGLGGT